MRSIPSCMNPPSQGVRIPIGQIALPGDLTVFDSAQGIVLFAHGSGSGRHSPRNKFVAEVLQHAGFGTLLFDLLTPHEEAQERYTGHLRFDIGLLTERLVAATDWLSVDPATSCFSLGYFGASTGAAAALGAAAQRLDRIEAVVSRGGRPDLTPPQALAVVRAPTLLIVGGADEPVVEMNREALARLTVHDKRLIIVPGATHLFEQPGTLESVAQVAAEWFAQYLLQPETATAV